MSKKFTKELVDDLADKLLIGLSDEENAMVLNEFDAIDANIDLINEIDGIKDFYLISILLKGCPHFIYDRTFRIGDNIRAVHLHEVGFDEESCFT